MSFGEPRHDPIDRPIRLATPCRPLNQIEWELTCAMQEAVSTQGDAAVPFIEDDELGNGDAFVPIFGRPLTLNEAMVAREILAAPIMEKWRRQICIARELGASATRAEYFIGCELQRLDPLIAEQTR